VLAYGGVRLHDIVIRRLDAAVARHQEPGRRCDLQVATDNGVRNLIINPARPPFDNPELRRALSLTLDRKAFVDILVDGQGLVGGVMQPPPDGVWGLPAEKLAELPGYDPDVAKNRSEARAIMEKLGYGPDKRLAVTVSTRNTAGYRDPAVIAIDLMKRFWTQRRDRRQRS
jgi:peptide/nickel transport system substrate-binding protein